MSDLITRSALSATLGAAILASPWLVANADAAVTARIERQASRAIETCNAETLRAAIGKANEVDRLPIIDRFNSHCSIKLAESEGPRPQDRVFLNYNYFSASVGGSAVSASVPQMNFGAYFNGTREIPVLSTPGTLHGGGVSGQFTLSPGVLPSNTFQPGIGPQFVSPILVPPVGSLQFNFNYFSADGSSNATITGFNTGFAFINPFGGFGGITALPGGQAIHTKSNLDYGDLSLVTKFAVINSGGPGALSLSGGLSVSRSDFKVDAFLQNIANPGINSINTFRSTSTFAGPTFVADYLFQFPNSNIYAGVNGFITPGYLSTTGTASQSLSCNTCLAGFRFINLGESDSLSRFAVQTGFGARVGILINDNVRLEVFGKYVYNSATGNWQAPATNTDPPVRLAHKDTDFWAAGLNFNVEFRY